MEQYPYVATIEKEAPGVYSVIAENGGSKYVTLFSGSRARTRALEYAHVKFQEVISAL